MPLGTILALLSAAEALVQEAPVVLALIQQAIKLISGGTAPTTTEWDQLDAALLAAHTAIQNHKNASAASPAPAA